MKLNVALIPMVLAGALITTGCPKISAEHQQRTAPISYNSVTFTDYDLNRNFRYGIKGPDDVLRLSVNKHGIRRTESDTSQVFVVLRNHTDYNYMAEARTQFFDQSEIPVDLKPAWQRVVVPANSTAVYLEKSATTVALKYRVEVRQAK
jgi:hypothetical protein